MTLRLAVLCSGRGSNLRAIQQAIAAGTLDAEVAGVFSDRPDAPALQFVAPELRWAHAIKSFDSREQYEAALTDAVTTVSADLVVCAGYMRILSTGFIEAQHGRILNIHPSLLPKYPGLDTHARALADGESEHGATVHQVIPALDSGPVLAQSSVKVLRTDTPASLAARVLACEHPLLVSVLQSMARGDLKLNENGPYRPGHREFSPLRLECGE